MPRSRNPEKYDMLYFDILDAVCEGKVVELPFEEREGKSFATQFYAFITSVGAALAKDCKGVDPRIADRLMARRQDYGQVAILHVKGGVKMMLKALTPRSQMIRAALERAELASASVEPNAELVELSAQRIMAKYGQRAGGTGLLTTEPPRGAGNSDEEKAPEGAGPGALGRPNPYY